VRSTWPYRNRNALELQLRRRTHATVNRKVRQEGGDVPAVEFTRMAPAMKKHESTNPADIRLHRSGAELAGTAGARHLVEKLRPFCAGLTSVRPSSHTFRCGCLPSTLRKGEGQVHARRGRKGAPQWLLLRQDHTSCPSVTAAKRRKASGCSTLQEHNDFRPSANGPRSAPSIATRPGRVKSAAPMAHVLAGDSVARPANDRVRNSRIWPPASA
jgi:hypothetical protein